MYGWKTLDFDQSPSSEASWLGSSLFPKEALNCEKVMCIVHLLDMLQYFLLQFRYLELSEHQEAMLYW